MASGVDFLAGGLAYAAASLLLLLPGVDPAGSPWPFVMARVLQGIGIGFALPAALSVVPRLVATARQGVALAMGGLSHNLTLVVVPPLSLVILDQYGLTGVAVAVLMALALAFALTLVRRFNVPRPEVPAGAAPRPLRLTFRREWLAPLAITLLFSAHWGLVVAYLPQRAEAYGASIGLFFAADGIGVLLTRLPAGWIADRYAPLRPLLAGIAITIGGVALLLLPPTTPLLVLAGLLTGGGAAFITTPILLALSRRSSDADRGSAFALFSAAFAIALTLGSIGAAPVIDNLGFEVSMLVMLGALVLSAVVALLDRGLTVSGTGVDESGRGRSGSNSAVVGYSSQRQNTKSAAPTSPARARGVSRHEDRCREGTRAQRTPCRARAGRAVETDRRRCRAIWLSAAPARRRLSRQRLRTPAQRSCRSDELLRPVGRRAARPAAEARGAARLRKGQVVIGLLQPLIDPTAMAASGQAGRHRDQPRRPAAHAVSRAQSMDALSSQANVGGYKAVLSRRTPTAATSRC